MDSVPGLFRHSGASWEKGVRKTRRGQHSMISTVRPQDSAQCEDTGSAAPPPPTRTNDTE